MKKQSLLWMLKDLNHWMKKAPLLITAEKEGYLGNFKDDTNININLFKKLNYSFK